MVQFKNNAGTPNALVYRKTGAEWEIYGALSERLNHMDDAKEAYRLCLEQRLSTTAWLKLLHIYGEEGNIQQALTAAVKLVNLADRAFVEHTYPSAVCRGVLGLVKSHGLVKVQNALIAMNVPPNSYRHLT